MLFPSTSIFPCQYRSTNAPYSYSIHLPPTLCTESKQLTASLKKTLFTAVDSATSGVYLGINIFYAVFFRLSWTLGLSFSFKLNTFYNLKNKNQLDATYYFIVLLLGSTCFGHYFAHHQELATMI